MKNKIVVLSGKGGVGKSTITALLSRALAAKDKEKNVSSEYANLCSFLVAVVCGRKKNSFYCLLFEIVHVSLAGKQSALI